MPRQSLTKVSERAYTQRSKANMYEHSKGEWRATIERLNTEGNASYSCIECTAPCTRYTVYVLVGYINRSNPMPEFRFLSWNSCCLDIDLYDITKKDTFAIQFETIGIWRDTVGNRRSNELFAKISEWYIPNETICVTRK